MTEQERAERLVLLDAELVVLGEKIKVLTEELRKMNEWHSGRTSDGVSAGGRALSTADHLSGDLDRLQTHQGAYPSVYGRQEV